MRAQRKRTWMLPEGVITGDVILAAAKDLVNKILESENPSQEDIDALRRMEAQLTEEQLTELRSGYR